MCTDGSPASAVYEAGLSDFVQKRTQLGEIYTAVYCLAADLNIDNNNIYTEYAGMHTPKHQGPAYKLDCAGTTAKCIVRVVSYTVKGGHT